MHQTYNYSLDMKKNRIYESPLLGCEVISVGENLLDASFGAAGYPGGFDATTDTNDYGSF